MNINNGKYQCEICKKQYSKKHSLEKHKILCDFKMKTTRELKIAEEEEEDIPTYLQLVKVVQELTIKCNKLEEKLELAMKFVERKKEKINIVEWLNKNINATIGYNEWIEHGFQTNFEYLMDNNLHETIQFILETNLNAKDNTFTNPIICISEKHSTFYIASKLETGESLWRKAEFDDLALIFKKIYSSLLKELTQWKKENEDKFDQNIKLNEKFQNSVKKLMTMSFSNDINFGKMRNILSKLIKMDLKTIVEYEFTS